jgi:4-hydroxybenzoate polyprenyltransferase
MKSKILNYAHLARLDKPIGIYLLLWPSLLGLLLGAISNGSIDFENILIVVVGSILVRSCGCVINDISDRDFDKAVERTKERPLASGNISLGEAWIFFIILSIASFSLLLATPLLTIKIALCVSLLIVLYPLSKRFLKAPQLILGITFGSGSVISYSLQSEIFSLSIIILYFGLVAWIVSFDSFYALEDINDDKKIGINSTPILWGDKTIFIANILHLIFYASLLLIAYLNEFSIFFLFTIGILSLLLYSQNQLAKKERYLNAFKINNYIGLVAVLGFASEIFLI